MVWSCPMQNWYLFEVFIFYLRKVQFCILVQDIIIIIVIYNRKINEINKSFYFFLKCFYSIYLFMGKEYMSQCPCEGERQPKEICPPSTAVGPRDWTRVPWLSSICLTHWATSLRLWILSIKERWTPGKLHVIQVAEGFQWGFEIQVWTAGPHGHCQSLLKHPTFTLLPERSWTGGPRPSD